MAGSAQSAAREQHCPRYIAVSEFPIDPTVFFPKGPYEMQGEPLLSGEELQKYLIGSGIPGSFIVTNLQTPMFISMNIRSTQAHQRAIHRAKVKSIRRRAWK